MVAQIPKGVYTMKAKRAIIKHNAAAYRKAIKKEKGTCSTMLWKLPGTTGPMPPIGFSCPVRTFADWDDARPGFMEMDMVAHEGGNPSGEYALTLNLTDVSSGWTKTAGGQEQGPEVGFQGTGADSKQIALPAARPGLGQ